MKKTTKTKKSETPVITKRIGEERLSRVHLINEIHLVDKQTKGLGFIDRLLVYIGSACVGGLIGLAILYVIYN